MESNDSPEIPDREETSDIPGLPSGDKAMESLQWRHLIQWGERPTILQEIPTLNDICKSGVDIRAYNKLTATQTVRYGSA